MATENWTEVCIPVPTAKGVEVALEDFEKFASSTAAEDWTKVCIPVPTAKGVEVGLQYARKFVSEHPLLSAGILFLLYYCPDVPFKVACHLLYGVPRAVLRWIVSCIGFTEDGVGRDTWASRYQSSEFRGYTPRDSRFAHYQSLGARGYVGGKDSGHGVFTSIVGWGAFFAGGYVLFRLTRAQ